MRRLKAWMFKTVCAVTALGAAVTGTVQASPVGGEMYHADQVQARTSDWYAITFRRGEAATIVVSGDGDTDLDLLVYDEHGHAIAADVDDGDDCVVRFFPRKSGTFRVEVRNLGYVSNVYRMGAG